MCKAAQETQHSKRLKCCEKKKIFFFYDRFKTLMIEQRDIYRNVAKRFNTSFEFENAIKTPFGVRHMMYEELSRFTSVRRSKLMKNYGNRRKPQTS